MTYPLRDSRRFTDRMVRESGDLFAQALAYAQGYAGDWEVMLDAQHAARTGGFTVPIARMVLNAMRSDPRVQGPEFPDQPIADVIDVPRWQRRPQEPERTYRNRSMLRLQARVKTRYVVPANGKVHLARPEAVIEWDFRDGRSVVELGRPAMRARSLWVVAVCGKSYGRSPGMRLTDHPPADVEHCRRCTQLSAVENHPADPEARWESFDG